MGGGRRQPRARDRARGGPAGVCVRADARHVRDGQRARAVPRRFRLHACRHRVRVRVQQPRRGDSWLRAATSCSSRRRVPATSSTAEATRADAVRAQRCLRRDGDARRRRGDRGVPRPQPHDRRADAAPCSGLMLDLAPARDELDADRDRVARRAARAAAASGCSGRSATRTRTSPHYRARFDAAGVHPGDCRRSTTWRRSRSRRRPTCATTTRSGCSRCRASRSCASTPRAARPGRPTVVGYTQRRHRHVGGRDGPLDPRAPAAGPATSSTSRTATACSPAASARTTAPSGSAARSIPVSGGMTERQVRLIVDFEPDVIMVTPSYMLAILDEFERQGVDPRASLAEGRHLRRRAVDRGDARARSRSASTCTRSTSTGCPR